MKQIGIFVGILLILSSFLILISAYSPPYYFILHWIVFLFILASGLLFIFSSKIRRVSLFVCGQCNQSFITELDLRKHFLEHIKKDTTDKMKDGNEKNGSV